MEESAAKDQSSATGRSASRLLRYPLRSATRSKEEKPPLADTSNTKSSAKRGRLASSVSKSVGGLDFSGKDKSAKPPRRLSVPSKSNSSPAPKYFGNITPISETRTKRSAGNQGKSDTPLSDVSKSSHRKRFSVLSSASYWLTQIKLSESAAKHSISLSFFKLALEAGCEPMQRMSDELKSYVHRHNLSELGDSVKELFESYKISETFEQSQVSETSSQVADEGNQQSQVTETSSQVSAEDNQLSQVSETSSQVPAVGKVSETSSQVFTEGSQLSDDDVNSSSSSIMDAEKLKQKALDTNFTETHRVKKANNKTSQKDDSGKKTRRSVPINIKVSKSGSEVRGRHSTQKKPQAPVKQESASDKNKVKQEKKSAPGKGTLNSPQKEALQENKENMGAPQMEEITVAED